MNQINPKKLHVQWENNARLHIPPNTRKYTLIHSDDTDDLYLYIGSSFAFEHLHPTRDEVLAEWKRVKQTLILFLYVYVGNKNSGKETNEQRKQVFQKNLPLALEAIRHGDQQLFQAYPSLDFSPILVHFTSEYPDLNVTEDYGSPYLYK
ncbi:staygreen family protein [Anoxybacillus sp. B7M1]|uniref:staygreen family protein n=1 Tax=unclassified Anoxybacillus TaxID=2639704 RepID=UPI0005CD00A8|nr:MULTISPECIES: staygreen family protein [unclassified Anoxybacillus]ANB59108.1 staygreen family protein [Anoxybacillus sp. B2M1]ANB65100.1 staygreen family protein [Anoxybacillus sp. B7M1]